MYLVLGGGGFGTLHVVHLRREMAAGRLAPRPVVLVDRDPDCPARRHLGPGDAFVLSDWAAYLVAHLPAEGEVLLPPYGDHLLARWLAARLAAAGRRVAVRPGPRLRFPYVLRRADVTYASAATWSCPLTCRAPARCPATRAPRTWDLPAELAAEAARRGFTALVFASVYKRPHVETVAVAELWQALASVMARDGARLWVVSASACHAAVSWLDVAA
jgi:hypothetical protein